MVVVTFKLADDSFWVLSTIWWSGFRWYNSNKMADGDTFYNNLMVGFLGGTMVVHSTTIWRSGFWVVQFLHNGGWWCNPNNMAHGHITQTIWRMACVMVLPLMAGSIPSQWCSYLFTDGYYFLSRSSYYTGCCSRMVWRYLLGVTTFLDDPKLLPQFFFTFG